MPIVSLSIQQQLQSAQSAFNAYPSTINVINDWRFIDEYTREALNPTNAYVLYTVAANGAGTGVQDNARRLLLTSGSTIGNDVSVRASGFSFMRIPVAVQLETRSTLTFDFGFNLPTSAADTEGFVGIIEDITQLTALPTTVRHLGLTWDRSAGANFTLTSGNGSAQATTDSTIAVDTNIRRLRMSWSGNNIGTVEIYDGNGDTAVVVETHSATTLNMASRTFTVHYFVQTEASAAKDLAIYEMKVTVSS